MENYDGHEFTKSNTLKMMKKCKVCGLRKKWPWTKMLECSGIAMIVLATLFMNQNMNNVA